MILELKNIGKTYNRHTDYKVHALKHINLTISEGDYIAIMGVSGSGKSTLLNILGCLDVSTDGTYYIDGESVNKLDVYDLRNRYIGFVLQSIGLLPDRTIYENVSYPLLVGSEVPYKQIKSKVISALKKVGIAELADRLVKQTSGGQRQRAAIARAIVANPEVILADEPTAALDSKTSDEIMEVFSKLNKEGRTIIIVTHDKRIADKCSRIIYIKDGTVEDDAEQENSEEQ